MLSNNASTAIMLRLPTDRLHFLRNDFEAISEGLNIDNFLSVMVEHMQFEEESEVIQCIPSLIDFFRDVDINGDGHMDWGEFVQFVISGVVREKIINSERIHHFNTAAIQPPASRLTVKCCKIIVPLRRIFVCIGPEILVYGIDEKSSTLLTACHKIGMQSNKIYTHSATTKSKLNVNDESSGLAAGSVPGNNELNVPAASQQNKKPAPQDTSAGDDVYAIDLAYVNSKDILCILRSDLCIEFVRFMSRNKMYVT